MFIFWKKTEQIMLRWIRDVLFLIHWKSSTDIFHSDAAKSKNKTAISQEQIIVCNIQRPPNYAHKSANFAQKHTKSWCCSFL